MNSSTETMESGENVYAASEVKLESRETDIETVIEYSCYLCEIKNQSKGGLKVHIGRKL